MNIAEHLEKWRRFDAARARLDPVGDFELWFWAILSAGTAIINAALHTAGLTRENHLFATQIPGVYAVYDGPGAWHHELATECDLIHVGVPELKCPLPPDLDRAFAAMNGIENFRDPCIRSSQPVTPEVVATCASAYSEVVAALEPRLRGRPR
jgi:hypothetical protein